MKKIIILSFSFILLAVIAVFGVNYYNSNFAKLWDRTVQAMASITDDITPGQHIYTLGITMLFY